MGRNYSHAILDSLVSRQNHCCAYCLLPFGTIVSKRGNVIIQRPEVDHFIPWAILESTEASNGIAACNICNNYKSDKVFNSIEEARRYILERRVERKVLVDYIPMVPLTEDVGAWGSEFARHISSDHD